MSGLSVCLVQRGPNISDNVLLDKNDIIVDEEYQYKEQNIIEDNNVAKDLNSLSLTLSEANSDKANKKIFKSKNNSNVFWLEIILAVIILLGWLVKYIYLNVFLPSSRKCKNCGKDDAMIILDENYEDQMGGYIKIRQTRKCKFCGYEETPFTCLCLRDTAVYFLRERDSRYQRSPPDYFPGSHLGFYLSISQRNRNGCLSMER